GRGSSRQPDRTRGWRPDASQIPLSPISFTTPTPRLRRGSSNHSKGDPMTDLDALLSQMTLEEKAALCTGATAWSTTPVERLGIPPMIVTDGPHGVRRAADLGELITQSL